MNDAAMAMRLTRDFRSFYDTPITAEKAVETVKHQLETRNARFLHAVERLIFAHPDSPYLKLLGAAGCQFGDIAALVRKKGIEGALLALCAAGVYITLEEFKGRKEAVRGSQRFAFAERDFNNPHVSSHIEIRTGATRGAGTLL